MSEGEWRPRRDDHLVEPFFAGLDLPAEEPRAESSLRFLGRLSLAVALLAALVLALGALVAVA